MEAPEGRLESEFLLMPAINTDPLVVFFFFLTSDATCETINPGPAEQSDCGNRLCMSVIGKSGGESETAASAILSVHENVQPSSQMIWASVYQKTLSQPTFRQIYSGDV